MDFFNFKHRSLYCEEVPLTKITQIYPTPFYVYSRKTILHHYQTLWQALKSHVFKICYSVKANSNLAILKILSDAGAGFDIVSGGELYRVLKVGVEPERIVYAGVGKTPSEVEYALRENILMFNVESLPEIELINKVARALGKKARIALRVNPNIKPATHHYLTTGREENKFGLSPSVIPSLLRKLKSYSEVELIGLHCHIGSQILELSPFKEALRRMKEVLKTLRGKGFSIKYFNIGGGLGIIYRQEKPANAKQFADAIIPFLEGINCRVLCEPGRFIVGNAGALITRVIYIKKARRKKFAIVDAAMNDLIRPAFYEAYHKILPLKERKTARSYSYDIVGPICESSDFLAKGRKLPELFAGEYLAVMSAGAYGFVMSSNYNSRPRVAEILVSGDKHFVIREAERYQDLIRGEKILTGE